MPEAAATTPTPSANDRQVAGTHYADQKIQHWDYVIANEIPYLEAQIIKYVSRHAKKNGIEDLRKAAHFLEKLLEVEQGKADARRTASLNAEAVQQEAEFLTMCGEEDGSIPTGAYINQG